MSKTTKPRPAKVPVVTVDSLTRATTRSIRSIHKTGCIKASTDAGFLKITGKYPYRRGYQVFVVAEPWSDEALIEFPESGGLISRAAKILLIRDLDKRNKDKARRHRAYLAKRAGIKLAARRPITFKKVGAK